MNSATFWLTLTMFLGAFSYCPASGENWVRRWEQQRPLASDADSDIRRLLKQTETSYQRHADSTSNSAQCGYQACHKGCTFFSRGLI